VAVVIDAAMMPATELPQIYQPLCRHLGLTGALPYTPHWSAAADFLERIVAHAETARPRRIVECGSGLSTLMLARACVLNGAGEVISLENGAEFAAATRAECARRHLPARVLHAPLQDYAIAGEHWPWYALDEMDANDIDMLVIDGPPGFLRPEARYPALPLLRHRLAPGCTIFLDDAARPDEQALVARWLTEFPELGVNRLALERGCCCLQV